MATLPAVAAASSPLPRFSSPRRSGPATRTVARVHLQANARRLVAKEAEVAELDKEAARQKKAVVVARKKLASKQAEADKHRPAVAHLQERVARLQKATKQERKRAAELAGAREEIEGQIASLRDDAAKIEKLQREARVLADTPLHRTALQCRTVHVGKMQCALLVAGASHGSGYLPRAV